MSWLTNLMPVFGRSCRWRYWSAFDWNSDAHTGSVSRRFLDVHCPTKDLPGSFVGAWQALIAQPLKLAVHARPQRLRAGPRVLKKQEEILREYAHTEEVHVLPAQKSFFDKLKDYVVGTEEDAKNRHEGKK